MDSCGADALFVTVFRRIGIFRSSAGRPARQLHEGLDHAGARRRIVEDEIAVLPGDVGSEYGGPRVGHCHPAGRGTVEVGGAHDKEPDRTDNTFHFMEAAGRKFLVIGLRLFVVSSMG